MSARVSLLDGTTYPEVEYTEVGRSVQSSSRLSGAPFACACPLPSTPFPQSLPSPFSVYIHTIRVFSILVIGHLRARGESDGDKSQWMIRSYFECKVLELGCVVNIAILATESGVDCMNGFQLHP